MAEKAEEEEPAGGGFPSAPTGSFLWEEYPDTQ